MSSLPYIVSHMNNILKPSSSDFGRIWSVQPCHWGLSPGAHPSPSSSSTPFLAHVLVRSITAMVSALFQRNPQQLFKNAQPTRNKPGNWIYSKMTISLSLRTRGSNRKNALCYIMYAIQCSLFSLCWCLTSNIDQCYTGISIVVCPISDHDGGTFFVRKRETFVEAKRLPLSDLYNEGL